MPLPAPVADPYLPAPSSAHAPHPDPDPEPEPNQDPDPTPSPAPLVEGEHVLCTLLPDTRAPPIDAVVVALDPAYVAAATSFAALPHPASSHSPNHHHPRSLTFAPPGPIDLDADDLLSHHPDDDNSSGKIRFREALEGKPPSASLDAYPRTPAQKIKRRREVSLPPALEAFAENGHIKPSAAPAPHPITIGRVYVHFSGRDRRLDRWVDAAHLERASESAVAAAASGVVENTLVDNAVHAEFAVTDTGKKHTPKLTRSRRRQYEETNPVSEREIGSEAAARLEKAREEKTKVRNISSIVFGEDHISAWYYSPYPGRYTSADKLYICRFCLKYTRTERDYVRHCTGCTWNGPPGHLIYKHPERQVAVYEVDGMVSSGYCQRLCLLGKLFLDHKTLYFDVAPFLFYVITIGDVLAGFFSKEKTPCHSNFNLACILTLPQHQRKGVGRFLITLSYELTKREGKTGSPERPLSDLGQLSYRSFWAYTIIEYLRSREGVAGISTKDVAQATGIRIADVSATLKSMNLVSIWKGETYAETSPKALDVAEKKTRKPLLPLKGSLLHVDTSGRETSGGTRGGRSKRKRPRKEAVRTKPVPSKSVNGEVISPLPRMSRAQVSMMAQFLQDCTLDELLAPLDSPQGISSAAVKRLARGLNMTRKACRVQMLKMAEGKESFKRNADDALSVARNADANGIESPSQRDPFYSSPSARYGVLSDQNDEVYVGVEPIMYSPSIPRRNQIREEEMFSHLHRETQLVRHPVSSNLREEVVFSASCTRGADENGVSDILSQETAQNGLFHSMPGEVEVPEGDSEERPMKRGRVRSRKNVEEVVVIHSPSPSS